MRSEAVAVAHQFSAMQRPLWKPAKLRGLWRLLTLLALPPRLSLGNCPFPPVRRYTALQPEFYGLSSFPAGIIVKFDCTSGYERIPGTDNSMQCIDGLQWSDPPEFCEGFCPPPPRLTTVKPKEQYAAMKKFRVGTRVQYECSEGYVTRGYPSEASINSCLENLQWSGVMELCQRSCPLPPNKKGAKLQASFERLRYFPVGTVVMYDCTGQYKRVPHTSNSITCLRNFQWSLLGVFCEESCSMPPVLSSANIITTFDGSQLFPAGTVITYECKEGYIHRRGMKNYVTCSKDLLWSNPEVFCQESCNWPPKIRGAKLKKEFEDMDYFPVGTVIRYECDRGFKHISGATTSLRCGDTVKWSRTGIFCEEVECDDPVTKHGVKVTGFKTKYIYGDRIAFECNIGYYMIGSYLIHCDANNMWNPKVPSCEKITAKLCGAPLVPSGIMHPLEPQYKLGTSVVIECSPQYSFPDETTEMTTMCQGYNLWKPPAQPCMFRTSPDTTELSIHNGIIIHGKKRKYKPGDNITVKCYAGYSLQGPSVVRYIGGKKWSPRIPYCSLSFFFRLLIAAILFFILLVIGKRTHRKYSKERMGSTPTLCWPSK